MSKTSSTNEATIEIINVTPRRRWQVAEKLRMARESMEPGNSVSVIARKNGVYPNLLYRWKRQMTDGGETAVAADNQVVSMAEFRSLQKKVQQLEKVLGRKTLEDECLLPLICEIIEARQTYGYRRVPAVLNHRLQAEGKRCVNHKRIYRIMHQQSLLLTRARW